MELNIGLTPEQLKGSVDLLTKVLANANVLYTKTRNYHWNVVSSDFKELHTLFQEQYEQMAESIDEIAERIRTLGSKAIGTHQEFTKHATLQEFPGEYPDAKTMVGNLLRDHESLIREMREDVKKCEQEFEDKSTADFISQLQQTHEKNAWMLRSYLS
ncbi:Dps family protein [Adhaeribacter terreus]|uniref:Dps family protein n=1 Tax=Adhaeribacter terreus TaxID=529703 RepID=A0ABW0E4Y4_9BACT